MNSASGGTPGGRGSHRSRLALYVGIGFFMASLAIAGYGLLGPSADAASGPARRAADVATNVPAAASPTAIVTAGIRGLAGTATVTPATPTPGGTLTAGDLAKIQAELDEIARQINSLQTQVQNVAPAAAGSVAVPAGGAVGSGLPMDEMGAMASTLEGMMSQLHSVMPLTDERTLPAQGMGVRAMGGPGAGMGAVGGSTHGHH